MMWARHPDDGDDFWENAPLSAIMSEVSRRSIQETGLCPFDSYDPTPDHDEDDIEPTLEGDDPDDEAIAFAASPVWVPTVPDAHDDIPF